MLSDDPKPGEVYGLLTIGKTKQRGSTGVSAKWECICECGEVVFVDKRNLKQGATKSCGCFRRLVTAERAYKHGHSKGNSLRTPTYLSWMGMVSRTTNPHDDRWNDYGGRGITICDAWLDFRSFLADMGERPVGLTLDRIDVDGNYEKSNCSWATNTEQRINQRRK